MLKARDTKNKRLHQPTHQNKPASKSSPKPTTAKQPLRRKNQRLHQPSFRNTNQQPSQQNRHTTNHQNTNQPNFKVESGWWIHRVTKGLRARDTKNKRLHQPTHQNKSASKLTKQLPHTKQPLRRKNQRLNQPSFRNTDQQPSHPTTPQITRNFKVESGW